MNDAHAKYPSDVAVPATGVTAAQGLAIDAGHASAESAMHWNETLRDGAHVLIRTIQKDDAQLERAFIESLSEQSQRQRFLGRVNISDDLIHRLTDLDPSHARAFIALVHREGKKLMVGISRYSIIADGSNCECAITVADDWQALGLGTLLMRHLIATAREQGIRAMVSIDSAVNMQMRELAHGLGFSTEIDPDDSSQVIHRLAL